MNEIFTKALDAFNKVLTIHLDSKTVNDPFHLRTKDIYEMLFEIAHESGERSVDLGSNLKDNHGERQAQGQEIIDILTDLKQQIESANDGESLGTQNLLQGFLDDLEFYLGTAQTFVACEGDNMFDEKEAKPMKEESKEDESKEEEPTPEVVEEPIEDEASESKQDEDKEKKEEALEVEIQI